ncbi:MAG: VOC family protein, partial [Candidatus Dormibacteria bacterium]
LAFDAGPGDRPAAAGAGGKGGAHSRGNGTTDCRGDYSRLCARGVEVVQPPAERPYGVEAVLRDNSGNWFSLTQRC